jgi:hypothetical protein
MIKEKTVFVSKEELLKRKHYLQGLLQNFNEARGRIAVSCFQHNHIIVSDNHLICTTFSFKDRNAICEFIAGLGGKYEILRDGQTISDSGDVSPSLGIKIDLKTIKIKK